MAEEDFNTYICPEIIKSNVLLLQYLSEVKTN
jgi:hypothetical protein